MTRALAVASLVMAACGAQVTGDDSIDNQLTDAANPDALVAPPDAPPDARPCAGGDNRATDATGTCFLYFASAKTRANAEADCIAHDAHLAKILSAEQNAVVRSITGGTVAFLGATDAVAEGTFLWPDNTPLTYTNYRAGEPNNGSGQYQEDCLVIEAAGTWDDRPCAPPPVNSGSYAYVCGY
ncbi:MAG: hypothetical protein KF773_37275 [Deltaproteobacteria bacterium]|nr:hypothetical protein [Deltaproteobacteria bacterium]